MKTYKFFRGLLKASAFATVMFVMQACYGTPQQYNAPYIDDEEYVDENDTIQPVEEEVPMEAEAE